jgi:hypothetical protein
MSLLGQNAKYSPRVDVFRFASKLRPSSMRSALRICANKRHRATTEGRLLLSIAEQLAGENIDEVHLAGDDKPLD